MENTLDQTSQKVDSELMKTNLPSETFNYWSHFGALLLWIPITLGLLISAWGRLDRMWVSLVYGAAVVFLFYSSSNYHKHKTAENEKSLRRTMDHFAIFVMIAGTYTPVASVWFPDPARGIILGVQWSLVLLGFLMAIFVRGRPRWVDPVIYVAMGWVVIVMIGWLWESMDRAAFWWMLVGGVFYTGGAVIYLLKMPNWKNSGLGFHEIFHLCIVGGALSHVFMVYLAVTAP